MLLWNIVFENWVSRRYLKKIGFCEGLNTWNLGFWFINFWQNVLETMVFYDIVVLKMEFKGIKQEKGHCHRIFIPVKFGKSLRFLT